MVKMGKLFMAIIITLFILSVFTLAYKYVPIRVVSPNGPTDYYWKPGSMMNTMEEGFSFLRTDANGYMNYHPKTAGNDVDVVVMGSSHVEGVQVTEKENMTYVMNDLLEDVVYNVGISGHDFFTCIDNLPNVISHFHPQKAIIIEMSSIPLSTDDMNMIMEERYPEINSKTGKLVEISQILFPATKRIVISLQSWIKNDSNGKKPEKTENISDEEFKAALQRFLPYVKTKTQDLRLIFFLHPSYKIDALGELIFTDDSQKREIFEEECLKNNIEFVDLREDYLKLYKDNHVLPNGFINTAIGSGHLNKYGHQLIGERLAEVIKEGEDET